MSYIKKTLTDNEHILLLKKNHWVFWFWPLFRLSMPFVLIIGAFLFWKGLSPFAIALTVVFAIILLGRLFILLIQHISTENAATNKRVIFKTGFIRTNTDELRNENIENIQIEQSLIGRILGYGNLEFRGTGGSPVVFQTIANPIATKKQIESIIYKSRKQDRPAH